MAAQEEDHVHRKPPIGASGMIAARSYQPAETPANGIFDATSADNLSLRLLKRLGMDFALAIATGAKQ